MSTLFYRIIVAVGLILALALASSFPTHAVDVVQDSCGAAGSSSAICSASGDDLNNLFANIASVLTFVIGAVAVIMIIVGAIKYVTANGDQSQISSAKNTILYSIVGLILAIAAGGIVVFVLERVGQ